MLLARLFAWLDRALGRVPAAGPGPAPTAAALPALSLARRGARAHPAVALLSVDGGGQWLLCGGERWTLGHLRAGRADLPFLADVGALHATLVRAESLHEGPGWRIEPCGDEPVSIDGEPVGHGGRRIPPDACVRLGENLAFRLRLPDPASASAVLELLQGAECAGARHIVLLAPGPGGRVRIGAARARHVPVLGLELELELRWQGHELEVVSEEPLAGALEGRVGRLPFPPPARLALTAGAPAGSRPPFGFSLEPLLRP